LQTRLPLTRERCPEMSEVKIDTFTARHQHANTSSVFPFIDHAVHIPFPRLLPQHHTIPLNHLQQQNPQHNNLPIKKTADHPSKNTKDNPLTNDAPSLPPRPNGPTPRPQHLPPRHPYPRSPRHASLPRSPTSKVLQWWCE
jgi:hypothetical protein